MGIMTYQEARKNAEHLRALGQDRVALFKGPYPWGMAESCTEGNSIRLGIPVSLNFEGRDTTSGLTFSWSAEMETDGSGGHRIHRFDAQKCQNIMVLVKPPVRRQVREYLAKCAAKIRAEAVEYQATVDEAMAVAGALSDMCGKWLEEGGE